MANPDKFDKRQLYLFITTCPANIILTLANMVLVKSPQHRSYMANPDKFDNRQLYLFITTCPAHIILTFASMALAKSPQHRSYMANTDKFDKRQLYLFITTCPANIILTFASMVLAKSPQHRSYMANLDKFDKRQLYLFITTSPANNILILAGMVLARIWKLGAQECLWNFGCPNFQGRPQYSEITTTDIYYVSTYWNKAKCYEIYIGVKEIELYVWKWHFNKLLTIILVSWEVIF